MASSTSANGAGFLASQFASDSCSRAVLLACRGYQAIRSSRRRNGGYPLPRSLDGVYCDALLPELRFQTANPDVRPKHPAPKRSWREAYRQEVLVLGFWPVAARTAGKGRGKGCPSRLFWSRELRYTERWDACLCRRRRHDANDYLQL